MNPDGENPGHRILIIDDEVNILNALKRCLRAESYEIHSADNYGDAFKLIESTEYAVIISDYIMPGIVGSEILQFAAGSQPRSIRVLLTGATKTKEAPPAIRSEILHCNHFLTKPWDNQDLKDFIKRAIDEYDRSAKALKISSKSPHQVSRK